jgi:transglutaminase-like putative cysteine protease
VNDARVSFERLTWVCGCLALALAPDVGRLPLWILATAAAAMAIRLTLAALGRGALPRAVRIAVTVCAIAALLLQFRTFNGISAGTALLALVAGLKLLETRTRRDLCVVALIVYFLSLAALLVGSSFWLLAYLIGVCWLTTATLLRVTVASASPDWPVSLRYAGKVLLHAVPIALALWLFFPRFAEPLWRVSGDDQSAISGLGESMSPGDITELVLSDQIAFHARFSSAPPPSEERYWRGPVLHEFDGRTWRRGGADLGAAPALIAAGPAYRYEISLEPQRHNWIYLLEWPARWDLPHGILTDDYMVMLPTVGRPIDVSAVSYTHAEFNGLLGDARRRSDTRLPRGSNPRTVEFARRLRAEHPAESDFIAAVLAKFRTEEFFYTLTPPPLGADSTDDFLFETRRGFCGHYASAFAVLMRAAGIPARVVTGYLGGSYNPYADRWVVRQSDAHAWTEVWIEGRGWLRVDPTAAIAPARVDRSVREAQNAAGAFGFESAGRLPWIADLRLRMDALRELWRARILQYDQDSQQTVLAHLMIPEPDSRKLIIVLAGALSLVLAWLTWQVRGELRARPRDPLSRSYARLCAKLAARGLPRQPHEGAETYAARITQSRPELGLAVQSLCRQYNELRYGAGHSSGDAARFAAAVRAFRPRHSRGSSET